MLRRCKHAWEVVGCSFVPPNVRVLKTHGSLSYDEKCIVFGYTTVSLRCTICGDVATKQTVGEYDAGS